MLETLGVYWRKISKRILGYVTVYPKKSITKKRVLLSYILDPFLLLPNQTLSTRHSNYFECKTIAEYFLDRGFIVDCIDSKNKTFIPKKTYSYFLDVGSNIERLKPYLNKDCKTIYHATTSYWKFNNEAESFRLKAFKERNNADMKPQRALIESKNFELADFVFGFGNSQTISTFPNTKPITIITQSLPHHFDYIERNWTDTQNNFLWLSGGGAVHKGLDLLLEIFRETPNKNLYICGPVASEKDFAHFYNKELSETKNIIYYGRIDIQSETFKEINQKCGFIIYPSCSEGQSGAVLVAMSAGLIPIISKESGVDINQNGKLLNTSSIDEIKSAIEWTESLSKENLQNISKKVYGSTNEKYGQRQFKQDLIEYFNKIIK